MPGLCSGKGRNFILMWGGLTVQNGDPDFEAASCHLPLLGLASALCPSPVQEGRKGAGGEEGEQHALASCVDPVQMLTVSIQLSSTTPSTLPLPLLSR